MNAQQQDIIRLLTSRGPMTSRELFDVMQDELGYWSQASSHDQQSIAVEALSKILSKMKSENLIYGSMQPQPKGRPVMAWFAPKAEGYIAGVDDIPEDDKSDSKFSTVGLCDNGKPLGNPHEPPVIGNLTSPGYIPDAENMRLTIGITELSEVIEMRVIDNSKRIETYNGIEILDMTAHASSDGCYLRGETVIRNKSQLAQFIGAIESMLP